MVTLPRHSTPPQKINVMVFLRTNLGRFSLNRGGQQEEGTNQEEGAILQSYFQVSSSSRFSTLLCFLPYSYSIQHLSPRFAVDFVSFSFQALFVMMFY